MRRPGVEVLGPKGPPLYEGEALIAWALNQIKIAHEIVDNPGGGLLFATQSIGQVKAALREADEERWEPVVAQLDRAEDAAVRREYATCRQHLDAAPALLESVPG